jgi:acyl transferase domain-containing protein
VKGGFFIDEDLTEFDAPFFNLTAEAAKAMDPQLRLLLEGVYQATEDGKLAIISRYAVWLELMQS